MSDNESDNSTNSTVSFSVSTISSSATYTSTILTSSINGVVNISMPHDLSALPDPIVSFIINESISTLGATIQNQQGTTAGGNVATNTTFVTNVVEDVDIAQDLEATVTSYYDNSADTETSRVVNEIRTYASQINCTNFQGKGTIDDYSQLFEAASKIANETKQIQLDVDISGFNEFGAAADELSSLFQGFILKLQNINIIDDLNFLRVVSSAMKKIANLAEVFGKFKQTILATSTIEIPQSAHDARLIVQDVMSEVNCAMSYINHFISPAAGGDAPENSELSATEKNVIDKAVDTIEHWSILSDQGVSVAMNNSVDIIYMKNASADLHSKATTMRSNVSTLRGKLNTYRAL